MNTGEHRRPAYICMCQKPCLIMRTNQDLFHAYYVPVIAKGTRDTVMSKPDNHPCVSEAWILVGGEK